MFVTFEATHETKPGPRNPKNTRRSDRIGRRGATPRACTSCRRRKTKCDGKKPCEACQWYKKPEVCCYLDQRPLQRKSATSPNYRGALERLFPDIAPDNLVNLSREKMLDLVAARGSQSSEQQDSPAITASIDTHASPLSIKRPDLEGLHSMPGEELDTCQTASVEDQTVHISDDVNALSLTARHPTSYLGVSSIQAALKVIAWLHPELEAHFSGALFRDRSGQALSTTEPRTQPTETEMLDAYFVSFHPFAPLLDESAFRMTYLAGSRKDDQWLTLLNIVLSLGSIAAAGSDDHTHRVYFERSMSYLNLYSLGNPSLEVVQALGLIGGWYCHYISQPNLGYSLMGASLRMAVTSGLQREPYDSHAAMDPTRAAFQDLRRRIWWSLACLETWGHETLGRPGMDCFGPSITVNPPRVDKGNYLDILPLTENIRYVKIASKIQDSLAALPTLSPTEMHDLDLQLVQWWENLPAVLKDYEPCPKPLYAVRTVMRWRFHNQRILLHRPVLLNYAMRRVPFMAIRAEERAAIQKCHKAAELCIRDISMTAELNQVIGWNAVWLSFQAAMVPLILLSTTTSSDDNDTDDNSRPSFNSCKTQVETAILTLDRMRAYGRTAERSHAVITRIFETILHGPGPEMEPPSDMMTDGNNLPPPQEPGPQFIDPALSGGLTGYQPATMRENIPNTAFFENFWPQHMAEYLSWEAGDLWPEVPGVNAQGEGAAFLNN
ncbi:fungal-specific transcription factor domain-containing protein [Aspergillus varians]